MSHQRKVSFMKQEVVVKTENSSMMSASIQRQETQVQELSEQASLGTLNICPYIENNYPHIIFFIFFK